MKQTTSTFLTSERNANIWTLILPGASVCHQPESIWWVVSVFLSEFVDRIVNGAADFVTDLAELLAERELPFTLVPIIVPPGSVVAGVVPVPRWEAAIQAVKIFIFVDTSPICSYWPQQVKLTVTPVSHGFWGHPDVLVFVLLCLFPFFSQPVIVLSKLNYLLHPLPHIDTLVLPIFVWGQKIMANVNLFRNERLQQTMESWVVKMARSENVYLPSLGWSFKAKPF